MGNRNTQPRGPNVRLVSLFKTEWKYFNQGPEPHRYIPRAIWGDIWHKYHVLYSVQPHFGQISQRKWKCHTELVSRTVRRTSGQNLLTAFATDSKQNVRQCKLSRNGCRTFCPLKKFVRWTPTVQTPCVENANQNSPRILFSLRNHSRSYCL